MKPRLKPRMFPEAGECLHDNRNFAEQMADLGVEIIRRKKEEVQVMDRENMGKTTIEERIDQLGLKGLLRDGRETRHRHGSGIPAAQIL